MLRKLKHLPFTSHLLEFDDSHECVICFNEFVEDQQVCQLKCSRKHIFHFDCLQQWVKMGRNTCPVCRQSIIEPGQLSNGSQRSIASIQQELELQDAMPAAAPLAEFVPF